MTEISIIIPSLEPPDEIKTRPYFEECNYEDYEVIVRADEGASTARNRGVEEAESDKLVFIDDDSTPQPGYIERMSARLDEYPMVAGRTIDPKEDYFTRLARNEWCDQGDEPHLTTKAVGNNMACRREVFEAVGGFDEELEWGHEDTIFVLEASREFDIYYEPEAVVKHRSFDSASEYWQKQWRYGWADAYATRKYESYNWFAPHRLIPFSPDKTIKGTVVKTIGKWLRTTRLVAALLSGAGKRKSDSY